VEDFREDAPAYFGQTVVHPVGLAVLALCALLIFLLPRRWAFASMLVLACFISPAQRVMVVGVNMDFPRLLMLAGWLRLLVRRELRRLDWNAVDSWLVAFAVLGLVAYTYLYLDVAAFKYRIGWMMDVVGFYFLFRFLFHGDPDPKRVGAVFALLSLPIAVCFAIEFETHHNLFAAFGGVAPITWVRDGRLRCQGPFAHPIIAGVFWASALPIVMSCWAAGGRWRLLAVLGFAGSTLIILASNSSTSVGALAAALIVMMAYPVRGWMRPIRWATVLTLFALHMVMKAPVWHLISRLSAFDSSTGWHRFFVIDQSLRHIGEWWLAGVKSTWTWDVEDITNEYVMVGIEGGVFTLICFNLMVWYAFMEAGKRMKLVFRDRVQSWISWGLGCSLFVHCTNFIGLCYFGQARLEWYLALALIASQSSWPAARTVVVVRRTPGTVPRAATRPA
jgi:hypothetical protein